MPILQLPSSNVQFFYLDSGRPDADDYTTLIISHGYAFHSGIFRQILPLAPGKGFRVIAINRQDYAPTTEFDVEELAQLASSDLSVQKSFIEARGREFALFTSHLIEELELPPPSEDGTHGGVAWMGWSMGNSLTIGALAATLTLPDPAKSRLLRYVRRHILYDCPHGSLGTPLPPKSYAPINDMTPIDQRGPIFAHWISSYFDHNLANHDFDDLEYKVPNASKKATVARMSEEEFAMSVDYKAGFRSDYPLLTAFQPAYFQQTEKTLFDSSVLADWYKSKFWVLYSDSSAWHVPHGAWTLEDMMKAHKMDHLHFRVIQDANHFIFWDDPVKAVDNFLYCLNN